MTVVDHPGRDAAALNLRIREEFAGRPCFKAESVLEDLLVLEFGGRRILIGRRGPVTAGQLRVSIQATPWFIERHGQMMLADGQVESEASEELDSLLIGRELQRVEWGVHCSLVFSDGVVLRCSRTAHEYSGDIIELRFANDDYADCFADGAIEIEPALEG